MPTDSSDSSVSQASAADSADHNDMVEVMRIWRDLGDGSLIIELGGRRYRSIADIANGELLRRFTAVVRELAQMINGMNGGNANRATSALPASSSVAMTEAVPPPSGSAGGLRNRIGVANPMSSEAEQDPLKARGLLRSAPRPVAAPADTAQRSGIADAVEDYLQFKLSNTPEYQARSIHVRPAVDGGVRIEVDGHYYDGVSDVVDADVRDFLAATLREWEARQ